MHPAPVVKHPSKKLEHSLSVVASVLCVHNLSVQLAPLTNQHFFPLPTKVRHFSPVPPLGYEVHG